MAPLYMTYLNWYQANIRASTDFSRSFMYCAFNDSTVDWFSRISRMCVSSNVSVNTTNRPVL